MAKEHEFRNVDLIDDEDEDTQKDKYLTFHVGQSVFGIEIVHVIEIVCIQKITEVPDMPTFVKGVINLRGQVIPTIDVRTRFSMPERAYDDRTCVVVVTVKDSTIGLLVDSVSEVLDIPEGSLSPPPKVGDGKASRFMKAIGKTGNDVKLILDVDRLLFDAELAALPASAAA